MWYVCLKKCKLTIIMKIVINRKSMSWNGFPLLRARKHGMSTSDVE